MSNIALVKLAEVPGYPDHETTLENSPKPTRLLVGCMKRANAASLNLKIENNFYD